MKIGIDLDDVTVDHIPGFCDFCNDKNGTNFCIDDFKSLRIWETIGGTRWQAIKLVKEFYKSKFFDNLELIKGAGEGIRKLANEHDACFITARFKSFKPKTNKCLEKNFNNVPTKGVFYSGFYNGARKKLKMCKKLGVELLIEDNIEYAIKCFEDGINVLLFDRPWNKGEMDWARVYTWDGILSKVDEIEKTGGIALGFALE